MVKNNCVEDAWDLVNKTDDNEWQRQSVNPVIYSTILRGFAMSKQPAKLMQVYTEVFLFSVIEACIRIGD